MSKTSAGYRSGPASVSNNPRSFWSASLSQGDRPTTWIPAGGSDRLEPGRVRGLLPRFLDQPLNGQTAGVLRRISAFAAPLEPVELGRAV